MVKRISVASAKNKGRLLQQFCRDMILDVYTTLEPDDVRSTSLGVVGEDVQLSPAARKKFSYSIECKANKKFALYKILEQTPHNRKSPPLAVLKGDRKKPVVVMYAEDFKKLLVELEEGREAIWRLEGLEK